MLGIKFLGKFTYSNINGIMTLNIIYFISELVDNGVENVAQYLK